MVRDIIASSTSQHELNYGMRSTKLKREVCHLGFEGKLQVLQNSSALARIEAGRKSTNLSSCLYMIITA